MLLLGLAIGLFIAGVPLVLIAIFSAGKADDAYLQGRLDEMIDEFQVPR